MPRIDLDVKLDFKDVLFRPKRSSLKSRSKSVRAQDGGGAVQRGLSSSCRASEGRTVEVPYRGASPPAERQRAGRWRCRTGGTKRTPSGTFWVATCTYVGAAKLKELSRRTTFIRVSQQASHMFT